MRPGDGVDAGNRVERARDTAAFAEPGIGIDDTLCSPDVVATLTRIRDARLGLGLPTALPRSAVPHGFVVQNASAGGDESELRHGLPRSTRLRTGSPVDPGHSEGSGLALQHVTRRKLPA